VRKLATLGLAGVLAFGVAAPAAANSAPHDKPSCNSARNTHGHLFRTLKVTQTVHFKWCVTTDDVWSSALHVKDTWRTRSGKGAHCDAWTGVFVTTYFSDKRGHQGKTPNTVWCHDGRKHYSHTATIRHPKRYFWAKDYKPPWDANVTVGHPRPPGPEYGEIHGHLDPFEVPLRSQVLRIIVSAAVARADALAGV
jgi:hypothetical protein